MRAERKPFPVALTSLLSLLAAPVIVWSLVNVDPRQAVAFVAAALLVEQLPATMRDRVQSSLLTVVAFVALLVGGTPLAVVSLLGGAPVFFARADGDRLMKVFFNVSQYTLAFWLAGTVFTAISASPDGIEGLGGSLSSMTLVAVLVAALVATVVNHGLVALGVSLYVGERFVQALITLRHSLILQIPYVALSVLAAVLIKDVGPGALLFVVVPALVARAGLMSFQRLDEAYERLVKSFAKAIEIKDEYTKGHSERVSHLSNLVAAELGFTYEERRLTRYAAMLHDVGKIGVPLCVINKPSDLDASEWEQMRQHPIIGAEILRDIDFLQPAIEIVRHHHERLDGRGYPDGLTAAQLTPMVRIVSAVDAFDAMTSTRAYRWSMSVEEALQEVHDCSGTQFDVDVAKALASVIQRIDWEPTTFWPGDPTEIPRVKRLEPLSERHGPARSTVEIEVVATSEPPEASS